MKNKNKFYGNQYVRSITMRIIYYFKKYITILAVICILGWTTAIGIKIGEHAQVTDIVYAQIEIETIKEVHKIAPVMDRIKNCESGGKHIDPKTGQVRTVANNNKTVDIGLYQINEYYWGKTATDMGLNLMVEEDNEKFAYWLYEQKGTEPWIWSKSCWNK